MSLKYAQKRKVFLFIFFATIKACNILFIAYMLKLMLNVASSGKKDMMQLVGLAGITAVGQIFFMCSNFLYEANKMEIIRQVNLYLKRKNIAYLVDQGESNIKQDLSLMTNDLKQIETNRVTAQLDMIFQSITFVGALSLAFYNSWEMTLIFIVASLAPAIVQIFTSKIITQKAKVWTKTNADYTQSISDSLNGASAANLYNARDNILQRASKSALRMENALKSMNLTQAWALELIYSAAELFCFIIPCTIGGILMMEGKLAVGTLVMLVDLAMNFITPVVTIFQEFNQVKSTVPMWEKTKKATIYNLDDEVEERESFTGLEVKNLSYQTASDKKTIFANVNLKVKPGEKVLLMAPSGWGKTTLLRLMLGQKNPQAGEILINQKDVSGNWEAAHNYYSYVNQKPFLFDDTLRFNITLGRTCTEEELLAAIKEAGLNDLVENKGLDFYVGENGNKLSGGQIQRVEIARALLSRRPIILADEATSALDPGMSRAIHETLLKNPKVAVIEVAHKISGYEKEMFDQIVKFK